MAIWEYTNHDTSSLYKLLALYEALEEETDESQDDDMMRELRAEIEKREGGEPQYLITFMATNNDTSAETTMTILLTYFPDVEDVNNRVKESYDGVWVPDMASIKIYGLHCMDKSILANQLTQNVLEQKNDKED